MKKNILYSIITIIILLLLASNSFFYIVYRKSINNIQNIGQKTSKLENEIQNIKKLVSDGWTIYSNSKKGFEIWYPNEGVKQLYVTEDDYAPWYAQGKAPMHKISFNPVPVNSDPNFPPPPTYFNIFIYDKNITDMKKFIGEELDWSYDSKSKGVEQFISQVKINNIDAYKFETEDYIKYYFQRNNTIFVLNFDAQLYTPGSFNEFKLVFDQMVQSFRFTE